MNRSMGTGGHVEVRDEPPLRSCVINRPERRNALSLTVCDDLRAAVSQPPPGVSLVMIGHTGDTFSSGADLTEIGRALLEAEPPPSEAPTLLAIRRLLAAVEEAAVPVVAAVDGRCLAGGLELALACDVVAATRPSRFFDAHLAGALLPSGGATVRLPERLGAGRAFRFLVEGVQLSAEEAAGWGLVDVVFNGIDELRDWARALAAHLGRVPAGLIRRVRGELRAGRQPRDGAGFRRELSDLDSYAADERQELRRRLARYLGPGDG